MEVSSTQCLISDPCVTYIEMYYEDKKDYSSFAFVNQRNMTILYVMIKSDSIEFSRDMHNSIPTFSSL